MLAWLEDLVLDVVDIVLVWFANGGPRRPGPC